MKKQFLLAVLPALLVLSACSAGPKKANNVLLEDALAHEEIFGEVGNAIDLRVRKTAVQENNDEVSSQPVGAAKSLSAPAVGVQYQPLTNGYYAIRYVAAITDLDVTAVWTRNICKSNGNRIKEDNSQVPVTKAYTALASDGGVDLPAANQYYVVYTLRNIPESDMNSYLFAYLTLTKGEESVKSVARVSRMAAGKTFTFDTTSINGYFLQGNFGDAQNSIVPINDTPLDANGNFAEKENIALKQNDEFGLFKYIPGNDEHFQCFGYDAYASGTNLITKVNDSNYSKINANGTYSLYLNKSNEVHFAKCTTIYLNVGVWNADNAEERYASWVWGGNASRWFDWQLISGNRYSITLDLGRYTTSHLCRMNSAVQNNGWGDNGNPIWNRIDNINLPSSNDTNIEYYVNGWSYGDWGAVSQ